MLEFTLEISAIKRAENQLFFYLFFPIFACVYDIDIFRILWYIEYVNYQEIIEHTFLIITPTTVDSNSCIEWWLLFIVRI